MGKVKGCIFRSCGLLGVLALGCGVIRVGHTHTVPSATPNGLDAGRDAVHIKPYYAG